jgi:D-aspartate ligase
MSIPAVVVGASGACGLGVVRSLTRADVPVILLDTDSAAPAMQSRFARKRVISALSGPLLVKELLALSAALGGPAVLFLTSDEAVLTVSEFRGALEGNYRFRPPRRDLLSSLMHKTSLQKWAEEHDFLVPRCVRVEHLADLRQLETLRFPCIVKPAIKNADYVARHFARAYKVAAIQDAEAICRGILSVAPGLVVQEWIEGASSDIYFCLQYRACTGTTLCSFTGRKLRIWPPDVGTTASCTAAPEVQPILQPLTEAFFRAVSFVGMGGIEYKKDARTGRFLMIEPTVGRVDAQEEVATLNGVNIPLTAYHYECGLDIPEMKEGSRRVIWLDTWAHWRSVRSSHSEPRIEVDAAIRDAYWRINDPMPGLSHTMNGSARLIQRTLRRVKAHLGRRSQAPAE